ncbi:MAG: GPW/gp25 family protein [Helicobacter sp.]|uniref:GPW/gp25 family protein n=1 Tax=Helicobacter sp. TaxID=218 RepID=UPI0023CAD782|nr:GPW/gp25 family protein [Helicobacter sp.]MDE7175751.1 GPW/gp25 family protein [Helicobacter sp.]
MNVFYQASLEESLKRILETPLGSRVMLPEFGSKLYLLTDRKMDDNFKLDFYRYVAEAIEKWEKRVKLERVVLEEVKDSKVHYTLFFKDNSSFSGVLNV